MTDILSPELVLKYTYDVTSADCDMQARLRPGGLVNYLILSAINSADALGFGFEGLRGQNLFWVLSRMTIEIYKPMKWYDKAVVETWPKDVDGLLYLRDFIVRNQHGEVTARCTSGWLAIDIHSKRPRKVDEKHSYIFDRMKGKNALENRPEKLSSVEIGEPSLVKTTWFDLDLNKHVTSTRYVDWMMDALPADLLSDNYPSRLSINFMRETVANETVRIIRAVKGERIFRFEGTIDPGEKPSFRGTIAF